MTRLRGRPHPALALISAIEACGSAELGMQPLPPQIQTMRYPDLDLAKTYPVLSPAIPESPGGGTIPVADINGLAGSIASASGIGRWPAPPGRHAELPAGADYRAAPVT